VAKRNRERLPAGDGDRTADANTSRVRRTRTSRPPRRVAQGSLFERYSGLLIVGVGAVGVLVIVFLVFGGGGARAAYICESLLTPGPVEQAPPAAPATPIASPSPASSPADDAAPSPEPTPAPEPTPRLGFTTANLGRLHVSHPQTVTYGFCPPTSGDHHSALNVGPIRPGFYPATEERLPGGWVHNLEHGYVVALYRCENGQCPSDAELQQLRRFTEEAPASRVNPACTNKVIAARFDGMDTRYAMVAWGRALLMDEFDLDTALTFAEQWIDHEAVPERGVC
jgi:hypothetical protein